MFVIIESDGDIDYTSVYGPFASPEEANAALEALPSEDTLDNQYRVEPIRDPSTLTFG